MDLNNQAIPTLGVLNSYDQDLVQKLNFLDNLKCLGEVLQLWRGRGLSLSGKILVFKTLALSRLLYACTMKIPSKQLIDQLYVLHKNFIWDKKRPKIKHSTLIADNSEGGYKDINIKSKISSLKFSWGTRLLDNNFHPWKIIPTKIFAVFGGLGELLSWSEAEQKFSLNRAQILNWLGLLNCIPKAWKNKLAANSK